MEIKRGMRINTRYGMGSIGGWNNTHVMINLDNTAIIAIDDKLNYVEPNVLDDETLQSDSICIKKADVEQQLMDSALADLMIDDLKENRDRI